MNREQKSKLLHVLNGGLQRGWSGKGSEQTAYLRKGNVGNVAPEHLVDEKVSEDTPSDFNFLPKLKFLFLQEHFDCGPPNDDQHPNFWPAPEDLPGFRKFVEHFYTYGQTISLQIMEACGVGLHLLPGTLTAIEKLQRRLKKRTWPRTELGIITPLSRHSRRARA